MSKSFRGVEVPKDSIVSEPIVVKSKHNVSQLESMTKKELLAYVKEAGIAVNSRKKKEEIISIILRS